MSLTLSAKCNAQRSLFPWCLAIAAAICAGCGREADGERQQNEVLAGVMERSLITRSVGMWLLLRLAIAPFAAAAGGHPVFLSPAAALLVIAVCAMLCWLVIRRWFEDLMLGNLGTSPWMVACLVVIPPVVLELAVARLAVV